MMFKLLLICIVNYTRTAHDRKKWKSLKKMARKSLMKIRENAWWKFDENGKKISRKFVMKIWWKWQENFKKIRDENFMKILKENVKKIEVACYKRLSSNWLRKKIPDLQRTIPQTSFQRLSRAWGMNDF